VPAPDALAQIAGRARPWWERLDGRDASEQAPSSDASAARLERWRTVLDAVDDHAFRRRLTWDGLDEAAVRAALAASPVETGPLPAWTALLRRLLESAPWDEMFATPDSRERDGSSRPAMPARPFDDLVRPLVAAARRLLDERIGAQTVLDRGAMRDLDRALLRRLTRLCAECLYLQFSAFRARQTTSFGRLLERTSGGSETGLYRTFVTRTAARRMADLFTEFPCLARLVAIAVDDWLASAAELVARLEADAPALSAALHEGRELGKVTGVVTDLSDLHDGGRSTFALTFSTGVRVIYKPRNLGIDAATFGLLGWLNDHGASPRFRLLTILDRGDYGWVEYVDHRPCHDLTEARRYYTRVGMLVCLAYALGGTDLHLENIIACGEQPILVDLETIMHPVRRETGVLDRPLSRAIRWERQESVMRTGLLPRWVDRGGGRGVDTSGLGATAFRRTSRPEPVWRDANTDAMRLGHEHLDIPANANAVVIAGMPVRPADFVREIEAGFRSMYRLLVTDREAILADDGPLRTLRHQCVRYIPRSTALYTAIAERANRPECLRAGLDRSIELDALARDALQDAGPPPLWQLTRIEARALERGDIPRFAVAADSDSLVAEDVVISGCFEGSSFANARDRLLRLGDQDLERQVGAIRAAMRARDARHGPGIEDDPDSAPLPAVTPASAAAIVAEAATIAESIRRDAIGDLTSGVAWMTMSYAPSIQRFQLDVSGNGLYDGGCGIAMFLAALEHVSGGAGFRELALAALAPLRSTLEDGDTARLVREGGIGGGTGLGSLVYGLTAVARLLGEGSLLDDARRVAALLTPALAEKDRAHDVISGAAGAILGLLSLAAMTDGDEALERAADYGRQLLARQQTGESGGRSWPDRNGIMLAGFGHGAAGIAYALLRLYEETADARFREAAVDAIVYEDGMFSPEARNWPDLRERTPSSAGPVYLSSWCNGGPGVGLARLGGLAGLDTPGVRADIDAAVRISLRSPGSGLDHLCCGGLGRADILLEIGRVLSRPDLVQSAQQQIAAISQRARDDGGYRLWWSHTAGVSLPGMFQGTSGIGYTLLRAAFPQRLPSVLLWH